MADIPTDVATWLAFWRCPGNHRFALLDFRMEVLVGDNILKVVHPAGVVPQVIVKYITLLTDFTISHHSLQSLHQLHLKRQDDFMPAQAVQLQSLDTLHSQGMLYAEKHCRKLAMGCAEYLPIAAAETCL